MLFRAYLFVDAVRVGGASVYSFGFLGISTILRVSSSSSGCSPDAMTTRFYLLIHNALPAFSEYLRTAFIDFYRRMSAHKPARCRALALPRVLKRLWFASARDYTKGK